MGHCLSQPILVDLNINVQIRNSWTLSFLCNLYTLEALLTSKSLCEIDTKTQLPMWTPQTQKLKIPADEKNFVHSNLTLLIEGCIKYTENQASNKEKICASSLRALGFIV